MQKKTLYVIAKSRLVVSRFFALLIILLLLFTGHSFKQGALVDISFEISGLLLISISSFGRLWSLIYISGYKSKNLISEGPYSIVRHPLYFFSFIGAIGIGLTSENILILVLIAGFYLFYYPFTILAEEKKLTEKFGDAYIEYCKRVPRFWPKISLYIEPEFYKISIGNLIRNFTEAMLLIWIYILMHFIELMQDEGILHVFVRFP